MTDDFYVSPVARTPAVRDVYAIEGQVAMPEAGESDPHAHTCKNTYDAPYSAAFPSHARGSIQNGAKKEHKGEHLYFFEGYDIYKYPGRLSWNFVLAALTLRACSVSILSFLSRFQVRSLAESR